MEPKHRVHRRVAALLLAVCLLSAAGCKKNEETEEQTDTTPKLTYAEGAVGLEVDALQKAVDEMYAASSETGLTLEYKNDAISEDGQTVSCYMANAAENTYDMYIQIFSDSELTDQLLLTGLLRPGTAFDTITLDHPLDSGTHRVYVAFTQVEEDLETIHKQIIVTMDITVK